MAHPRTRVIAVILIVLAAAGAAGYLAIDEGLSGHDHTHSEIQLHELRPQEFRTEWLSLEELGYVTKFTTGIGAKPRPMIVSRSGQGPIGRGFARVAANRA
jgi:hypothetical protein